MNHPDNKESIFNKTFPNKNDISFRPFEIVNDASIIHEWVNMPYAIYWGMIGTSLEEFKVAYNKILSSETKVYIGEIQGQQKVLIEKYNANKELNKYYEADQGDIGMHILIGPPIVLIHNFTWKVFSSVIEFIFLDETVERIVVEPDIRNEKIHVLNKKAGFQYQKEIQLPHKKAWLATCTREQFSEALKKNS